MLARVAEILNSIADGGPQASLPVRLCQECVVALSITGVGLTLMTADGLSGGMVAVTDRPAQGMEELQFALGQGPCVDASRSRRPVLQPDLLSTAVARWPEFGAAIPTAGVRAIFAFPLQVGAFRLGVLALYRDTPGRLGDSELTDALAYADAATTLLLDLQDQAGANREHPALTGALDNRAVVHQATGMISVQLGVSPTEALLRLRAHAYATDRPMHDISVAVVGRRMRFDHSEYGSTTIKGGR
ncbi:MAG: GAF and ANTAR domain-containing protein [Geodermatophilaceae bacterium]|jgi:hypothetical protein|nr:GAF and ANTAR domain-containing protein [Geodermatophilaceae bacterium]MBA3799891.1 GAF and ANTAR domain-containing protein [Geodermatophilaceae bacterium]